MNAKICQPKSAAGFRARLWSPLCSALFLIVQPACGDTTGGARVSFAAVASGPADATSGPLTFSSGLGYRITLRRAQLFVGAVYLNQTVPTSGAQETSCIRPGIYVAQITSSLRINALSPDPQPFPTPGEGIASAALSGELWLTSGDINRSADNTVILDAEGEAERGGVTYPFLAQITIGTNRAIPSADPAYPSKNPICKQRIVSLIPTDLTPQSEGRLRLRVDPRAWFQTVDFSLVPRVQDSPPLHRFSDQNDNPADLSLYNNGLRRRTGAYSFSWEASP